MKDAVINEKENEIDRLRKELFASRHHHHNKTSSNPPHSSSIDTKQLLEIVEQLTQENSALKKRLNQSTISATESGKGGGSSETNKNDFYNQIHNKIDILKISIDKKGQESSSE